MPDEFLESFCGMGNPFSLCPINLGRSSWMWSAAQDLTSLLQVDSSAHRDGYAELTSRRKWQRVQMYLRRTGVSNGAVHLAGSGAIPYDDSTFDMVISNVVLMNPHR
ncbi:MAG: hypothetical protein QY305_08220 [Candidatus Brocadiaceae baterium WH-1]|nr:MAG: hypothetical protein QY305_08220 [Candidatus Jettenia sp. AMX2]